MFIKKIGFIFIILATLSLAILFIWHYKRPYVIISGNIIYDDFKKGDIEIYWATKLKHGPPAIPFPGNAIYLDKLGFYLLKVPKNYGNIYICARNRGPANKSYAYFISDPMKIGLNDIPGYNIALKTNRLSMDIYKGKTVKLSGKVSCSDCKKGIIDVCVYSTDWFKKVRLPPDIAKTVLAAPGGFSLEAPANIGEVCITAINIPEGERSGNSPRCLRADYNKNPLLIKDEDIHNIDIKIN